jgi:preprotein translocase subunit SecG
VVVVIERLTTFVLKTLLILMLLFLFLVLMQHRNAIDCAALLGVVDEDDDASRIEVPRNAKNTNR